MLLVLAAPLATEAQQTEVCESAAVYEPCEIRLEMTEAEAAQHPNPYVSVELRAEFRSPDGGRTSRISGFWDGGRSFGIRFSPTAEGRWDFRILSNLPSLNEKIFSFQATSPRTPGFVKVFNSRYFRYDAPETAHYWMGDTCYEFAGLPWETFTALVDKRAEQKFNHLRGLVIGRDEVAQRLLANPDQPPLERFREVDRRVAYLNSKGITFDVLFGGDRNQLAELLPERAQRERYIRHVTARLAAYNVVWQGVQEFEEYEDGREFLKEIMGYVKQWDPYDHPRSTHTVSTSSPLADDGWMTYIVEQSSAESLASIDYETHLMPVVNAEFGYENSGAGASHPHHVPTDEFRRRAWQMAMRGLFPTYGNTGTYGGRQFDVSLQYADAPGAQAMTHLYDFFTQTRWFDMQPYYGVVEGGPALAFEYTPYRSDEKVGVEYVVYVEEPGPIEVILPKDGYDVSWFNPIDGSQIDEKKKFKGDRFQAPGPPDDSHAWVLYLRREGKKESFDKRYKLEARAVKPKEVETSTSELPFEIQLPAEGTLATGVEQPFNATLTSASRVSKQMLWLWIGEVAGSRRAPRVLGTTQFGKFRIPEDLSERYPATLSVRLLGLDGAGRLFEDFRAYKLVRGE